MMVPSVFGALAQNQNLQAYFDNSLDALQTPAIWRNYLDVGLPQVSLTFQTAIGRSRIEAAASIVDSDSPAPLRSRKTIELLQGKIPTMKEKFQMNQDDYRALMMISALPISDAQKKVELQKLLSNDMDNAATSTDKRLDILTLQGVSTLTMDVSVTNNPDGANYGVIDLLAKPYQKQGVPILWTDAAADPFMDIENYIINIMNTFGRQFGDIEMSYELWILFKRHPKVIARLAGFYNIGKVVNTQFAVTESAVNEYMTANGWPAIDVINEFRNVEKDGKPTIFKPFNAHNISFQPSGKIGILHNAFAINEWKKNPAVNYAMYGRAIVSKWQDDDPFREYTAVEMNAFPGIESIDNIFILQTNVQQTTFIAA